MGWRDKWPTSEDGDEYDSETLTTMISHGSNPFDGQWDIQLLLDEVEQRLHISITDIKDIAKGSNNFGIHVGTTDGRELICRLARGDVNMPEFDGFPIHEQVPEVKFEAAVYNLLRDDPKIRASRLLYHRAPVEHSGAKTKVPSDLTGRRLLVFERAGGTNNLWEVFDSHGKKILVEDLATIRAALFHFAVPDEFAHEFLHERMFKFKPERFTLPVSSTRDFWMHVLNLKIEATIGKAGDMIGWEDDEETVGPVALSAKQSLLRAIPLILPAEDERKLLYRHVLEHGDYGIHNTSIETASNGLPYVTSLFDWETGCIVPAMLADPLVAAGPVDLITNEKGKPSVTRVPGDATTSELELYQGWSDAYIGKLYEKAPDLELAIKSGKELRHLWYTFRDWRGGDSEEFFGGLGAWAESIIASHGA